MKKNVRTAALISLGCVKNLVDSQGIASQLVARGHEMTGALDGAGVIVVNTCGFLESAVEESIETIIRVAAYKEKGTCDCLVAAGCMIQRFGKKLVPLMPEVDLFVGTSHFHRLGTAIESWDAEGTRRLWIGPPRHLCDGESVGCHATDFPLAYLKIAEGCSNRCSYCLIPRLRGPCRSRSIDEIAMEAARLAAEGIKELNLVAQDTTAFGLDRGEEDALSRLLGVLETNVSPEWIRVLYCYPDRITGSLLRTIAASEKVLPYLDIPFQHCVPEILEGMGRKVGCRRVEDVLERIRFHLPGATLRTTLMVGFPGETEKDFRELIRFVERSEFDHLGVFAFSPEAGSRAARYPHQVPREIREERRGILMEVQRGISRRKLMNKVGAVFPVLVEGYHQETEMLLRGRLPSQAPEADGMVIITEGKAEIGEIIPAKITAAHDYDLEARLLREERQLSFGRPGGASPERCSPHGAKRVPSERF
ncbi:MAG: 30S ribosomal protein S12 methylthiotransferase RimO [Deltaproteobacteria bacterium]|nr:30S ribosomal protein S12 methylthiotransferase RimO [Deltaproteobacteria bacterium]